VHMKVLGYPIPYRHFHIIRLVMRLLHIVAGKPSTHEIGVADMQDIHAAFPTIEVEHKMWLHLNTIVEMKVSFGIFRNHPYK
jgi:hypothetical protein